MADDELHSASQPPEIVGRAGMGRMARVWFGILIGGITLVVIVVAVTISTK